MSLPAYRPTRLVLLALLLTLSSCASTRTDQPPAATCMAGAGTVVPPGFTYGATDTFSVATWNAEHFVDPFDDPYVDATRENDAAAMGGRLPAFEAVVRALDADVLVLQEVESPAFVLALADSLVPDLEYRFVAGPTSLSWYQNVVVLSRLPLGVVQTFSSAWSPIEGSTDAAGLPEASSLINHRLWIAEVLARPGYSFHLVGAHLKAGRGARNEGWRRGQIRLLHATLAQLAARCPSADVLVAGDLNALVGSDELALLLNADRSASPVAFFDPLPDSAYTHPADAPVRRLDYLLPSVTMAPAFVDGSAQVLHPLPPEAQRRASDHLPVVARFVAP